MLVTSQLGKVGRGSCKLQFLLALSTADAPSFFIWLATAINPAEPPFAARTFAGPGEGDTRGGLFGGVVNISGTGDFSFGFLGDFALFDEAC